MNGMKNEAERIESNNILKSSQHTPDIHTLSHERSLRKQTHWNNRSPNAQLQSTI